jgi:hypothetical protein
LKQEGLIYKQMTGSPPFRIWGTLKYNDTSKNVKFVIISSMKQNVCLLPSKIFTRKHINDKPEIG